MTNAQILQLTGLVLLPMALTWIASPKTMRQTVRDIAESKGMLLISAMAAIVIGYLVLTFKEESSSAAGAIATILGWISLIKGFGIMILSATKLSVAGVLRKLRVYYNFMPWLVLALAVVALYYGYIA